MIPLLCKTSRDKITLTKDVDLHILLRIDIESLMKSYNLVPLCYSSGTNIKSDNGSLTVVPTDGALKVPKCSARVATANNVIKLYQPLFVVFP